MRQCRVRSFFSVTAAVTCSAAAAALSPVRGLAQTTASFDCASWQIGEAGHLRASGLDGIIHLAVQDSDGKTIWERSIPASADGKLDTELPVRQAGYYTLTLAGTRSVPPISFAVVPQNPTTAPPVSFTAPDHRLLLGVCTHYSFSTREQSSASFTMLKNAGIDLVRDEIFWGDIEPAKRAYQFPARYDYAKTLQQNGIGLMVVAGYSNKLYGPGRKPPVGEGTAAYGQYCAEILKHYGSAISFLEVYNEPNDFNPVTEYLPLLRDTFTQVRGAGLKQPIVAVGGAGVGGGMNPTFAAKLFEAGGAAYCDSFSQHPYTSPSSPDLGYAIKDGTERNANLDLALRRAAGLLNRYKKSRGGWITEQGWPAPGAVSEKKQAAFVSRAILTASAYPHLEGYILYDFEDDGVDPKNKEHHFGLVRPDLTPKPSFQAYATAAHFLKDKTFVRSLINRDSRLMANVYKDGTGEYWVACWATELTLNETGAAGGNKDESTRIRLIQDNGDETLSFQMRPSSALAGSYDWQGRPVSGAALMTASILPLYIRTGLKSDTITLQAAVP